MVNSIHYSVAHCLFLLAVVQYLKGQSLEYSLEFGVTWAVISIGIFALRRIYNYRKNINCALCNDLPNSNREPGESKYT